jgi:ATP/maltotriose-dependent transcriptional regulator MalT
LSRQSGALDVAATTYQQAKATAQELDDKNAIGYVLSGEGDVFTDRGDLAAARKAYEESLALRNQLGEKQFAAETQVALAALSIEEGKAADAESVARTCKNQFHQEQQADDELAASVVLIHALLAQGDYDQAKPESQDSEALAAKSQNQLVRLQFALASTEVQVASDHPESARPRLSQILKEARAHGFVGAELETQLVLAQLEKKSGRMAAARAQLTSLQRNARAKGFDLIARKAAAELG